MRHRILTLTGLGFLLVAPLLEAQGRGRPAGPPGGGARMNPPPAARSARQAPPAARKAPAAPRQAQERKGAATARRPEARPANAGKGQGRPLPRDFGRHPDIEARMRPMLPQGMGVHDAAAGFKNTGQFVAATNVSRNLGIPFDVLKGHMMAGNSLGQAIQNSRPGLSRGDARRHAREAERFADREMRDWSRGSTRRGDRERVGSPQPPDS